MSSIVFFGTGPVAAASLDHLRSKFDIEFVVTKTRVEGFKGIAPVEELAYRYNLPLHSVAKRTELDDLFNNTPFKSRVGIVVDFGIIMSQSVIERFPMGIINSHFSLLPRWRGADPISYTVLYGDAKAGVSLMVIDEGLDTGKLITYKSIPTASKETAATLTEKLIRLSNELIDSHVPEYLSGEMTPRAQPHPDRVTYSHKIHKPDASIDWTESAEIIERKIRAYQPWPKARATLGHIDCIILDADIIDDSSSTPGHITATNHQLIIQTGSGALSINTLQPLGKKEMPVSAFLAGYRTQIET